MRDVSLTPHSMLLPSAGIAQVQVNQTFIPQGPAPANTANFTDTGAVQTVMLDPSLGPNTIFIGSTNGGIWRTTNGGASWTPLTDNQASLSIASLGLDPTDPSGKTLVAGIGATSNGLWSGLPSLGRGGSRTGLLYSTDGGNTWSPMGTTTLSGMSVIGAAALGSTILAATFENKDPSNTSSSYGLYRSINGGANFSLVSGASGTGLPAGPVSSLVADPANPNTFYAAVTSADKNNYSQTAVYKSIDGGATWKQVFDQANSSGTITSTYQTFVRVAAGPDGSVAVGVVTVCNKTDCPTTHGTVAGLFWSSDSGSTWKTLPAPSGFSSWGQALNNIHQADANFAIAIDPNNSRLVYVSGDEPPNATTLPAYRIDVNTLTATSLTGPGFTSNGSTAHSDSRVIAFNSAGQLLMGSDGGVYLQTSPQTTSGQWQGLNSGLQTGEPYVVVYGANAKMLFVARQDNGVAVQSAANSLVYNAIVAGDGHNAAVNDTRFSQSSAFYGSTQFLGGLSRLIVNSQGNVVSPGSSGVPVTCSGLGFVESCGDAVGAHTTSPFVLNRADQSRIAMAGQYVYVTQDTAAATAASVVLPLTDPVGGTGGNVQALAYGTTHNPNVLLAGSETGLFLSTTAQAGSLTKLDRYKGDTASSLVFDQRSQNRFYVADGANLWGTQNQGTTIQKLTSNLPATLTNPTSLEFINNNGVNALLVGGISNTANAQSPISVADGDTNGNLSGWRLFGSGLPNVLVNQMAYNPFVDVLAVSAVGRGTWTLYDVTSYFPQATALQFGLANNDSQPDASFLSDGTSLNGTGFSRPLNKYGTGTLTIAGDATYTGGTTIFGGALQLGNGGASGSILGNVAFCSDGGNPLCDSSTNKALVFNRSDTYTFDGAISGPGQVVQFGSGKTVLTAVNTYTGPTYVLGGTLSVNGSIASSPVFVDFGGTLGGNGTVGPTTILAGGALSPGNSVGTLTVNGNVMFAAGSFYLVDVQGTTADRTDATGTAMLAGTVGLSSLGGKLARSYTILSASGGRTGTFDSLVPMNLPAFVTASLAYTPTDVQLNLTSGIRRIAGLTHNNAAVAAALDSAFDGGGSLLGLYGLTPSQIPAALDMLSGEGVSGTQETAFAAADMFTSIMMDEGAFWRNRESVDVNGVSFAGEPLAYAPSKKPNSDHPAFKAMPTNEAPISQSRWRAWLTGFDTTTRLDGEPAIGSATLSHNTGGLAGGLDYQFAPDLLAGFAMGGSSSNFSVRDRITSGYLEGAHLGGYGVKTWGSLYAAGALSFSTFRNSEARSIVGIGPAETASGSFDSNLLSGRIEMGWKQAWRWFALTPFVAVQPAQLWQNGFTELNTVPPGAPDPLGLSFGARSVTSLPTFLGAQFDTSLSFPNAMTLSPYARLSWVHEFKPDRAIDASFIALPTTAFSVDGPRAARDAARVDAGAKLAIAPNAWVFASFDGEFSNRSQSYAGKGGARFIW
jgi:autotransporter-associated beta strand protein